MTQREGQCVVCGNLTPHRVLLIPSGDLWAYACPQDCSANAQRLGRVTDGRGIEVLPGEQGLLMATTGPVS